MKLNFSSWSTMRSNLGQVPRRVAWARRTMPAAAIACAAGMLALVTLPSTSSGRTSTSKSSCEVSGGMRLCGVPGGPLSSQGLSFPTAYSSDGSKANIAAAHADARQLLKRFKVPAATIVLGHEPAGDHGYLVPLRYQPSSAGVVNRWWVTTVAPQTLISDLDFHSPRGGLPVEYGSGGNNRNGTSVYNVTFQWPSIVNQLGSRTVTVSATQLRDGKTGVLLSSESFAVILRSISERIPAAVTEVRITTSQPTTTRVGAKVKSGRRRIEHLTVTNTAELERIVKVADAPPIASTGAFCTLQTASAARSLTIGFYGASGRQLALLKYTDFGPWGSSAANGCQPIKLSIDGRWRAPLLDVQFVTALRRVLPARMF